MLAVSLVFGSFLTVLFLVVGIIGGWVAREYLMNYQDAPRLHPEFFDEHGNVVPTKFSLSVLKKVSLQTNLKKKRIDL